MANESQSDDTPIEDPNAKEKQTSKSDLIAQEPAKKAGKAKTPFKSSKSAATKPTSRTKKATSTKSAQSTRTTKKPASAKTTGTAKKTSASGAASTTRTQKSAETGSAAKGKSAQADAAARQAAEESRDATGTSTGSIDWLWRILAILAFGFLSYVLILLSWVVAAAQYVVILVRGQANRQLISLMAQIRAYLGQILDYLAGRTSATDLPFPFGELPKSGEDEDITQ